MEHFTLETIGSRLAELGNSPQDHGKVVMIVARPEIGERVTLESAELDPIKGVIGDNWYTRGSRHTADGSAHPDMQIAVMNSRVVESISHNRDQWVHAGDQLFLDFDLSTANLAIGDRVQIGKALMEVTPMPHNGCAKFTERFGSGAIHLVNSPEGREQRRRGLYLKVIEAATIHVGDEVIKVNHSDNAN